MVENLKEIAQFFLSVILNLDNMAMFLGQNDPTEEESREIKTATGTHTERPPLVRALNEPTILADSHLLFREFLLNRRVKHFFT